MSRFTLKILSLLLAVLAVATLAPPAQAAQAGFGCSTIQNKTFIRTIKHDNIVFKVWHYGAGKGAHACWTAHMSVTHGHRSDWQVRTSKSGSTAFDQSFANVYAVGGTSNIYDKSVTIEVWGKVNGTSTWFYTVVDVAVG